METINVMYVVDKDRHLLGFVTIRQLLLADEEDLIGDIMDDGLISASTMDDQEETARKFKKYDFLTMPVVDKENRLVGIVTIDDAVDVLVEETTEDIERMAAISPSYKPYLNTGIMETVKSRIPWLLLLMVSATFTGQIISSFEDQLAAVTVLNAYIPMLMDTGGNSGSQASVTVIRGIALGEIEFSDILRVQGKELLSSLLCGITLAAVNFGKILLVDHLLLRGFDSLNEALTVALVVSITIAVVVVIAKFVGCTLPLLAKKVGLDPAVMASPFITTIVDAVSLLVYFGIAMLILPGI